MASAYKAAETLVYSAKAQAEFDSENRNKIELAKLELFWGLTGSKLANGGAKAVKDLEKLQKSRKTRLIRDNIDLALLDLASFYRDLMMLELQDECLIFNANIKIDNTQAIKELNISDLIKIISCILRSREKLALNVQTSLTLEGLMCEILSIYLK